MGKNKPNMPRIVRVRVEFDTMDSEGKVTKHTPLEWIENSGTKLKVTFQKSVTNFEMKAEYEEA